MEKVGEGWGRMGKVSKVPNTNLIVPGSMALQCDSVMEPRLQFMEKCPKNDTVVLVCLAWPLVRLDMLDHSLFHLTLVGLI